MSEILNPDYFDLIREGVIVLIGLVFRFFEKKYITNNNAAQ